MLGTKSDTKILADALHDLASAIREYTRSINGDEEEPSQSQCYLDGSPMD